MISKRCKNQNQNFRWEGKKRSLAEVAEHAMEKVQKQSLLVRMER